MYVTSSPWQATKKTVDLSPRSTVNDYFRRWDWDGALERIHHALYVACREAAGREASPTAAIIDSQTVKGAEKRGRSVDPPGYDAGKKIKGKKWHVLVDTQGLSMRAIVHAAVRPRGCHAHGLFGLRAAMHTGHSVLAPLRCTQTGDLVSGLS